MSWEYGDSVFLDFERRHERFELEYYEHGQLVAYPLAAEDEEPDEDGDVLFSIHDSTTELASAEYRAMGWLP